MTEEIETTNKHNKLIIEVIPKSFINLMPYCKYIQTYHYTKPITLNTKEESSNLPICPK